MRLDLDERLRPPVDLGPGALLQLPEPQVARLAFDQAQDAGPSLAGPQHGVRLPMAHLGARVGRRGAGADRALAGQAAAAVIAPVAFAPLFARSAQVGVQVAAQALVGPDGAVDRLVADREPPLAPRPAGDLLGPPVLPQQRVDPGPLHRREPLIARLRAPPPRVPVGQLGAVAAVAAGPIAPDLPPDGAAVVAEHAGDRGGGGGPPPHEAPSVPFLAGPLVVQPTLVHSPGRD